MGYEEFKKQFSKMFLVDLSNVEQFEEEIFKRAFEEVEGDNGITLEGINKLMKCANLSPVSQACHQTFFAGKTTQDMEDITEDFRKVSMWQYGSFTQALKELKDLDAPLQGPGQLTIREPLNIEKVDPVKAAEMGYFYVDLRKKARAITETMNFPNAAMILLAYEKDGTLEDATDQVLESLRPIAGFAGKPDELRLYLQDQAGALSTIERDLSKIIASELAKRDRWFKEVVRVAKRNYDEYLLADSLDVYVATSMRELAQFRAVNEAIEGIFEGPLLNGLNLRYFNPIASNPTESEDDDTRIEKGISECLMINKASIVIYNAQDRDSFGKDSEAALGLAAGKQVVVYAPNQGRYQAFRDVHPLGLQVMQRNGVCNGMYVAKSTDQVAQVVDNIVRQQVPTRIQETGRQWELRDEVTGSVLRVVSKNPLLTGAFWHDFKEPEKYAPLLLKR